MKLKQIKVKDTGKEDPKKRVATADALGGAYIDASERVKEFAQIKETKADEIRAFGKAYGIKRHKKNVVIGTTFAVGIGYRKQQPVLDEDGFRRALLAKPGGLAVWRKLTRRVLAERKLAAFLHDEQGYVAEQRMVRELFRSHCTARPPSEYVVVESAKPKTQDEVDLHAEDNE